MLSPRAFRLMTVGAMLLLSGGVFITGSILASQFETSCTDFVESFFVVFGAAAVLWSCFGLFFLLKNHPYWYFSYMVLQVLLSLGLLAALIAFWTLVATTDHGLERWWMRRFLSEHGWTPVMQCLMSTHFCRHFPDVGGCCQMPFGCDTDEKLDPDCLRWEGTNGKLCYPCFSCRRAIAHRLRAHGRSLQPAFVILILLMLLLVVVLIVEYLKRGALTSTDVPPRGHEPPVGAAEGVQEPPVGAAAGAVVREDEPPDRAVVERE